MKKKLNVEQIQSELSGNSAFFPNYKRNRESEISVNEPAENSSGDQQVPQGVPQPVPQGVPQDEPLIPKTLRPIRQRQPFDIFEDQYQTLKIIADAERGFVNGRGMSQMVREALDKYFENHGTPRK